MAVSYTSLLRTRNQDTNYLFLRAPQAAGSECRLLNKDLSINDYNRGELYYAAILHMVVLG